MPTYEYVCSGCGHEMEAFQRMSEAALTDCPSCEEPQLRRKIGRGAGIIFKGGGFYETDFKDKKGSAADSTKDSGSRSAAKSNSESSTKSDSGSATSSASEA